MRGCPGLYGEPRAPSQGPTDTRARTHTHTHAHTRMRAHTHIVSCYYMAGYKLTISVTTINTVIYNTVNSDLLPS